MQNVTTAAEAAQPVRRFAIEDYLAILRYRKWLVVIPVATLTVVTAFASLFMKNVYRSQTTILVSSGDVSGTLIPTTVTSSVEDRVKTVREQILSQTLLLNVIQAYELYPEMANGPTEDRVGRLRGNVRVELRGKDMFEVSFMGNDPLTVQNVTNRLAQMFISETYGDRQKSAKATSEFLAQRLEEMKTQLDEQEQKVADFKRAHIGALPEQMEANQRSMDRLQASAEALGEQIAKAEDRKVSIETKMAQLEGSLLASGSGQLVTQKDQLEQLEAQLSQMKQSLTDDHPDVKELQAKIARLKEELGSNKTLDGRQYRVNSVTRPLFERLQSTSLEIKSLRKQQGALLGQVSMLSSRVAMAPEVEQEMSVLVRDLQKMRETYQDLQKKHMEAKQAETLEAQQKGRQFKIVDEARFPERPYKPNRPRLTALAFVLGLLLGMGAIFVVEHMDHSFRDDQDLAAFANQPVLATIPRFTLEADVVRKANQMKLAIGIAGALGFLLLLFVVLKFGFGVNPLKFIRR